MYKRQPHNIARAVCEFACEELHDCDVYLGSPTEIAATLYAHALSRVDTTRLLFIDSEDRLPVVDRLACAADASDFIRIAASVGIEISERTAHRILGGSIPSLRSVASRLLREKTDSAHTQMCIRDRLTSGRAALPAVVRSHAISCQAAVGTCPAICRMHRI